MLAREFPDLKLEQQTERTACGAAPRVEFCRRASAIPTRSLRFSDTGFTGAQHYLAFAGRCPGPASQQQVEFFFPSDKLGQSGCVHSIEAPFNRGWW
jgi:hypothetical protein